jgi:hypothetical protein
MSNLVIDASPTLKRFLDARSNGASEKELKLLQAADEASRGIYRSSGNIIYLPDRSKEA